MRFQFMRQNSRDGIGIRGLSVVDERVAWASGTNGSVASTIDGGKSWHWSVIQSFGHLDFRSIKAFSGGSAIIANAGSPATILKTVDGGASWKAVFSDASGAMFFDALAFWDDHSGVVLGDPSGVACCMLGTVDGGQNWAQLPVSGLPVMLEGEAHFAASGTSIVAFGSGGLCFVSGGPSARAFMSHDRGASWKASAVPVMSGKPSRGLFSVAVYDETHMCTVGGDYAEPGIAIDTAAYSVEGGSSWIEAETFPPNGYNSCVAYVPGTGGRYLLATGTQGCHVSADGGRNWAALYPEPFHVLAFEQTGSCGWAAGTDGRISKIVAVQ